MPFPTCAFGAHVVPGCPMDEHRKWPDFHSPNAWRKPKDAVGKQSGSTNFNDSSKKGSFEFPVASEKNPRIGKFGENKSRSTSWFSKPWCNKWFVLPVGGHGFSRIWFRVLDTFIPRGSMATKSSNSVIQRKNTWCYHYWLLIIDDM